MGRLKVKLQHLKEKPLGNFNSTMGRLKEETSIQQCLIQLFQFHYGTIKSIRWVTINNTFRISIPLWDD